MIEPKYIALLTKPKALELLDNLEDDVKREYIYTLYQVGYMSYQEMIKAEIENGCENCDEYVNRSLISKILKKHTLNNDLYQELKMVSEDVEINGEIVINKNITNDIMVEADERDEETKKASNLLKEIFDTGKIFSIPLSNTSVYEILNEKLKRQYADASIERFIKKGEFAKS